MGNNAWRNVWKEKCPIYAHRKEEDKETLQEHIKCCEKYLGRIWEEKQLEVILKNIYHEFFNKENFKENLWEFFKEIFKSAILFHDLGKLNPVFQYEKMNNKEWKGKTIKGLSGSNHSLFSSIIYIDYYTSKLEDKTFRKEIQCEVKEKKILEMFVLAAAYVILKHHGDLESLEQLIDELNSPVMKELIETLQGEQTIGYIGLQYFNQGNCNKKANFYIHYRINQFSQEQDITYMIYERLLYATLVSCDYYSTTEYMNDIEYNEFGGGKNLEDLRERYNNSPLVNQIREYEQNQLIKKDICSQKNINDLRCEMFLESEKMLKENEEKNIYYLEAPTGGGKSNIAMNLSFSLLNEKKKLLYIYPFNTLVEQNITNLNCIFGKEIVDEYMAVINSITPMKATSEAQEDSNEYYTRTLLDRQFLNYPFILSTHVSFFNLLFGHKKEDLFGFLQLINSIVVLDEIQSYQIKIWAEIITFLQVYTKILGMKIIIMSATLPQLSLLDSKSREVVNLIQERDKYFKHPIFKDRVKISYKLLEEKADFEKLYAHVKQSSKQRKKVLVTFIRKKTANEFFQRIKDDEEITSQVELITGDDSSYERERILQPIKSGQITDIILVTTQVVEAGVDIDMDIGYKNIGKMDSDEQFLGRINRSNKGQGIVYFFEIDSPNKIYKEDYRVAEDKTLKNEVIRKMLLEKDFFSYYESMLMFIKKEKNSFNDKGYRFFFEHVVKRMRAKEISEHMKLIEENEGRVNVVLCRVIELEDGTQLDGEEIWREYKYLLQDFTMGFSEKQVKLSHVRSKLTYFTYSISKRNGVPIHNEQIGELYCLFDGDEYFKNGKLDIDRLEEKTANFI